jgi:hypothetical protein
VLEVQGKTRHNPTCNLSRLKIRQFVGIRRNVTDPEHGFGGCCKFTYRKRSKIIKSKKVFFVCISKATDDNSRIRRRIRNPVYPRIRIRFKMSRIRNIAYHTVFLKTEPVLVPFILARRMWSSIKPDWRTL